MTLKSLIPAVLITLSLSPVAQAAPLCSELFDTRPTMESIRQAMVSITGPDRELFLRPSMSPRPEAEEFAEKIQQSYERPIEADPGVILFHGHIFAEGYFRITKLGSNKSTNNLIEQQTWMKWHPDTQTYTQESTGIQQTLLKAELQQHQITLYRGLDSSQVKLLRQLKSGDDSALDQLLTAKKDAMFFTTDIEAARKWAKGYYIELTVDQSQINRIYTGIEYDYVEIAIPSKQVLKDSISTLKVSRTK